MVEYEIAPFFRDVAGRLAAAHLVIGRAGASTVCEIAVAKPPPSAIRRRRRGGAARCAAQARIALWTTTRARTLNPRLSWPMTAGA
jgi:hypothetical protein